MEAHSTTSRPTARGGVGRGVLTGLAPIVVFAVIIGMGMGVTILVRTLIAGQPFLTQLPELLVTVGVNVVIAFVAWILTLVWALRRERAWERNGDGAAAAATLWTLAISAIIMLTPVILAFALPQHPVHPAP